jgi:hypothetical protein
MDGGVWSGQGMVKEHVPPCVILVINDNPYGLMFALSSICWFRGCMKIELKNIM